MIDFSAPLSGLDRATSAVDKVASRIARTDETSGDSIDLSSEAIALLVARQNFESNIKAVQTADEMSRSVLDLLG
jgi:flagellar basal body rod protein FlgG